MAEVAIAPVQQAGVPIAGATPPPAPALPVGAQGPHLAPEQLAQLSQSTVAQSPSDAITVAATAAPNLDPHTVVSIAGTGGNVEQKAQALGAVLKIHHMIDSASEIAAVRGNPNAVDDALSWFGHNVVHPLGTAASFVGKTPLGKGLSDLGNILNQPLRDIQHQYRYLHDVEARHGLTAAIAEGLAISAGVVGGGVLGGPDGAVLGGEGAAQILGALGYHDSWLRTADGANYTDPNTHNTVSFGRDLASMFTHEKPGYLPGHGPTSLHPQLAPQSGIFATLSGVLDGIGDLVTDPLALAGKLKAGVSGIEGGRGVIGSHWGGMGVTDPTLIDRAYETNPSFKRAVNMIANHDSIAWVVSRFPKMIPIARFLAGARTPDEVLDVLKAPVLTANLWTDHLPTMSWARLGWIKTREAAEATSGRGGFLGGDNYFWGPARYARRFSKVTGSAFDDKIKEFSGKVLDPFSDQHAWDLHEFMSYTNPGLPADMAAEQWLAASPGQRIIFLRNLIMDQTAAVAHFTPIRDEAGNVVRDEHGALDYEEMLDPGVRSAMKAKLDEWTGGGDPGQTGVFGMHNDGSPSWRVHDNETGRAWAAAILHNQTGKIALPSFTEIKRMGGELRQLRQSGMFGSALDDIGYFSGKLDDFAYNAVTARYFKPFVLMSGSYAWHIGLAEAIPNTLRHGLLTMTRSYLRNFSSRVGYQPSAKEADAILGSIVNGMGDNGERLKQIAVESHIKAIDPNAEVFTQNYPKDAEGGQGSHLVVARDAHGKLIGQISWADKDNPAELPPMEDWSQRGDLFHAGEVMGIHVTDEYRRRGFASALWDAARELHARDPENIAEPIHSEELSTPGQAWVRYLEEDRPEVKVGPTLEQQQAKNALSLRMESETLLHIFLEGHKMTKAVSSSDSWSKEYSEGSRIIAALHDLTGGVPGRTTDRFGDFTPTTRIEGYKNGDPTGYLLHWRDAIREAIDSPESMMALRAYWSSARRGVASEADAINDAGRVAASELRKRPAKELAAFQRSYLYSEKWSKLGDTPPPGHEPIDDWGQEIAHNVRSLIGRTRPNEGLVEHMLHGTTPTVDRMTQLLPRDEWPASVKGRIQVPNTRGFMGNAANFAFRKGINPFVDFISREPLFRVEFYNQWKQIRPMVENGVWDLDEAVNIALNRATFKSVAFVHNLHDRSQISETLRNWLPFWFAQEQAYRRMGRLLTEDPGAARRYQMMISGVATMTGSAVDGTNGQRYYLIPGGTFLSRAAAEIFGRVLGPYNMGLVNIDAGQLQTSLSSAGVIFPLSSGYNPDKSPIAALSAKALYGMWPELGPDLTKLMGGTQSLTDPLWKFLVPNTFVQRIFESTPVPGVGQEADRAFVSAMNQAIALAAYEQTQATYRWIVGGKKGPAPHIVPPDATAGVTTQGGVQETKAQQDFINRIKNQTTILFLTNAITSFFLPTSTTPSVKDYGFTNEVNQDITKMNSVSKGVQKFLLEHPLATPYTVFKSYSPSGASLQATAPAENWINGHQDFINKYPKIAFFMVPPPKGKGQGTFDYSVYNEQLAQGNRVRRSPQEFLNAIYVEQGNVDYYPHLKAYEDIANAPGTSSRDRAAAFQEFQNWLLPFQAAHPIWHALGPLNVAAKQTAITEGLTQLEQMSRDGDTPDTLPARQIMDLYGAYKQFNVAYAEAQSSHRYATLTRELKQQWRGYLDAVVAKNPDLQSVVSSVFSGALGVTQEGMVSSGG